MQIAVQPNEFRQLLFAHIKPNRKFVYQFQRVKRRGMFTFNDKKYLPEYVLYFFIIAFFAVLLQNSRIS